MKTIYFIIICFLLIPSAFAQGQNDLLRIPPTQEEEYYSGDQVNPEAFSDDAYGYDQEEQELQEDSYGPYDESYPYENFETEEEYYQDY